MYFSPICVVIIITLFCWLFKKGYEKSFSRTQPYPSRMTIHNSLNIFPYVIMHKGKVDVLKVPNEFVKLHEIKKITDKTPRLIVMIYGESTSWVEMKILNDIHVMLWKQINSHLDVYI